MKIEISIFLFFLSVNIFGQEFSSAFKIIPVNKMVKNFPDKFDLTTPLNSGVTFTYILINGKDGLLRQASSAKYKYIFPAEAPDSKVGETLKNNYLYATIREYITYKDSVACFITERSDSSFSIRSLSKENGNWVNCGEDGSRSLVECRKHFEKYAEHQLQELRKINALSLVPTDTASLIDYLKTNAYEPKTFMLNKLKKTKLIMYGEIHYRKTSWDFLQTVVNDKLFQENAGVIFMEMASNKQPELDRFYSNKSIDRELLLNVFRDYMIAGWDDKGKFDFLISVWYLNQKLPDNKKIKIVAVDTPRIFTEEGIKYDTIDRDEFMASEIVNYLNSEKDKRNALFIVGSGHLYNTDKTAGSILAKKMPSFTYSIFTHCPRIDNFILVHERIRHGIFDYAFYKNGDKPVAFDLKNSPFGKEPFDGLYLDGSGIYQNNYDGYIFLGSLDTETNGELLLDMYDDKFISEIEGRYKLYGGSFTKDWGLNELSRKAVINKITSEHTKTRWENYVTPLKDGKIVQ